MANGWTGARRARQSAAIHRWQPWERSTGARTPDGKAASSRNAFRYTQRKGRIFAFYLSRERRKFNAGLPCASIAEMTLKMKLCGIDMSGVATPIEKG